MLQDDSGSATWALLAQEIPYEYVRGSIFHILLGIHGEYSVPVQGWDFYLGKEKLKRGTLRKEAIIIAMEYNNKRTLLSEIGASPHLLVIVEKATCQLLWNFWSL